MAVECAAQSGSRCSDDDDVIRRATVGGEYRKLISRQNEANRLVAGGASAEAGDIRCALAAGIGGKIGASIREC